MGQVINTNTLSLLTQNNLSKSQSALNTSIQRLSSGMRINSAKDDAAGQAIANRFSANIKGLTQAQRNANDGISLAQTTEGALNEVNNNLQRIRELTVQAANGSNSTADKASIQAEITQRLQEIDRTSAQTDFNGVKVLSSSAATLSIQVGSQDGESVSIGLSEISSNTLGLTGFKVDGDAVPASADYVAQVGTAQVGTAQVGTAGSTTAATASTGTVAGMTVTSAAAGATGGTNYVINFVDNSAGTGAVDNLDGTMTVTADFAGGATDTDVAGYLSAAGLTVTGDTGAAIAAAPGNVTMTGGADEVVTAASADYVAASADYVAASADYAPQVGTAAVAGTNTANPLAAIDAALAKVDEKRGSLGAVQNRFDSIISNLGTTINNLTSSKSRIEDADYATEVSNMTRAQILQQAGTSVLAKANQSTQGVMALLQ
jgi:flagellin